MKTKIAVSLALFALAGLAQAQTTRDFSFPSTPEKGHTQRPASTLRIQVTPGADRAMTGNYKDTPESLQQYKSCRQTSDNAAVSDEQLHAGLTRCLQDLEARRMR